MKYKIYSVILWVSLSLVLLTIAYKAFADDTDRSIEYIFNRVYQSSDNTIKVT